MSINEDLNLNVFVKSVSNERDLDQETIYSAIEAALAAQVAKQFGEEAELVWTEVVIDRNDGHYDAYRSWTVVADGAVEDPLREIALTEALEHSDEIDVGSVIRDELEMPTLGRIEAQNVKQMILQKVKEAERDKIAIQYQDKVMTMIYAVVKRRLQSGYILEMSSPDRAEAFLAKEHVLPRESFRPNDRVRVLLFEISDQRRGPQLLVSRTHPEFIRALFAVEVPEVSEDLIEIRSAARDPGSRAKIAVKTNDGRIDPIGACVGMRGSRVQAVSNELGGERIDIILWDENPAKLVINAMAPAEVASIVVDEDNHAMDIAVETSQLSQAIGRSGQNVRLASELSGWTLNVMSEEDLEKKHQGDSVAAKEVFEKELGLDAALVEKIITAGFKTIEELAYASLEELVALNDGDEEKAEELQLQASDYLLTRAMAQDAVLAQEGIDEALLALEGMTSEYASQLVEAGIKTRDDLAECSVDELQEMIAISDTDAAALIMTARAHWFEDESE